MKYTYQLSNAYAVAMNGYPGKQRSLSDVLGVIRRIGINLTSGKVNNKAGPVIVPPGRG